MSNGSRSQAEKESIFKRGVEWFPFLFAYPSNFRVHIRTYYISYRKQPKEEEEETSFYTCIYIDETVQDCTSRHSSRSPGIFLYKY